MRTVLELETASNPVPSAAIMLAGDKSAPYRSIEAVGDSIGTFIVSCVLGVGNRRRLTYAIFGMKGRWAVYILIVQRGREKLG